MRMVLSPYMRIDITKQRADTASLLQRMDLRQRFYLDQCKLIYGVVYAGPPGYVQEQGFITSGYTIYLSKQYPLRLQEHFPLLLVVTARLCCTRIHHPRPRLLVPYLA